MAAVDATVNVSDLEVLVSTTFIVSVVFSIFSFAYLMLNETRLANSTNIVKIKMIDQEDAIDMIIVKDV